jgi:putative ABC transport system permease protein
MKRLVALPFSASFHMAYQSIRIRFFRSLITTASLVLAVAFLSSIQIGNDFAQAMLTSGDPALRQQLIQTGYDIKDGTNSIATSAKQRWTVFLSLLVCVVGIINAQLMSVTERFREIGTLKCLGALDRFIVRLFVLEATMQGLAGSFCGILIGLLTAGLTTILRFGPAGVSFFPWRAILISALTALATGTLLSLLGVLYPALLAARMQPVEAMRVEQ